MKTKNNIEVDRLILYVKLSKVDEIVERYKLLGWNLVEKAENRLFEDLLDLTFERNHKIENKDDLQLMQIYMEDKLNAIGKVERRRHAKSTSLSLILGPLALVAILTGLIVIFQVSTAFVWTIASILFSLALVCVVLLAVLLPRLIKKENKTFEKRNLILHTELDHICNRAKLLLGEDNGNLKEEAQKAKN